MGICRAYGLQMMHILAQMMIVFLCHADMSKGVLGPLPSSGYPWSSAPRFSVSKCRKGLSIFLDDSGPLGRSFSCHLPGELFSGNQRG